MAELADLPAEVPRHGGGTGRRARLKIVFPQGSESSILSRGTKTTSARRQARIRLHCFEAMPGQETQNRVPARGLGFDSLPRHHRGNAI